LEDAPKDIEKDTGETVDERPKPVLVDKLPELALRRAAYLDGYRDGMSHILELILVFSIALILTMRFIDGRGA
jgi:hypothetical protein